MKIRNKFTGEINIVNVDEDYFNIYKDDGEFVCPVTLKELNAGWEGYEELKEYWFISDRGEIFHTEDNMSIDEKRKFFGNYFGTKEEAEKAVERLKKLQNLKNRGYNIDEYIDMIIERGEE